MAHDAFISYSTKDKPTADAVCATLEANGIRCWIAPRDILSGMDWGEAIIDAIHESRVMILIFSSNTNESQEFIKREVERAVNKGLTIIPVRIEDVVPAKSLEFFIGNLHWLDALTPPMEKHLEHLAETVKMLLSRIGKGDEEESDEQRRLDAEFQRLKLILTDQMNRNALAEARETVAAMLHIKPNDREALNARAIIDQRLARKDRTLPPWVNFKTAAIVLSILFLLLLGFALKGLKKPPEPIKETKEEREEKPSDQGASAVDAYNEGDRLYKAGQFREAIPYFDRAIKLDPSYTSAYNYRGNAYYAFGQYDRAIQDYNEAIRLDSRFMWAYNNRGLAYYYLGQYESAIKDYDEAIRLNPRFADAYNNRGLAYDNLGQYDRAIQDYNDAIRLNPSFALAYSNRGFAYYNLGQYDRAIQDYNEAIRLNPRYAQSYGNRGLVLLLQGKDAEAQKDFDQCFALNKDLRPLYEKLTKETKEKREGELSVTRSALAYKESQTLYEDNFAKLDPAWGAPSPDLSVKDGKLILQPNVNTGFVALNQANIFEDMDASIKVSMAKSDDPAWGGGLVFWAKDNSNYYVLLVSGDGQFSVRRYVNDRSLAPVDWRESAAIKKGVGQVNELRIVTKRSQATAYINDTEVVTFNGQPPQGGSLIGVKGSSAEKSQIVWEFSDLKVTK